MHTKFVKFRSYVENVTGFLFLSMMVFAFLVYGSSFLIGDVFEKPLPSFLRITIDYCTPPFMVLGFILFGLAILILILSCFDQKSDMQVTAELVIELQNKQKAMESEMKQLQAASCPFPWYATSVTTEQRITFEKELRRLCAACQSGSKGTTKPLVEWLLAQQSSGIILLPDNYTQIHQELAEHYGYGLSKQSFSAAMPAKVQ